MVAQRRSSETRAATEKRATGLRAGYYRGHKGANPHQRPFEAVLALQKLQMFGVARKFMGTVVPGIVKPLRVLWNEVIGFMFLSLAVIFGFSTWRRIKEFTGDASGLALLALSVMFVLMLAGFGLSSFFRARKINKS
jgi:hypothetical protein